MKVLKFGGLFLVDVQCYMWVIEISMIIYQVSGVVVVLFVLKGVINVFGVLCDQVVVGEDYSVLFVEFDKKVNGIVEELNV